MSLTAHDYVFAPDSGQIIQLKDITYAYYLLFLTVLV